MNYNIKHNLSDMHNQFNNECKDFTNYFKNNKLMKSIVQNCDEEHGIIHLQYIKDNYKDIYNKIDFYLLKVYDLVGEQGSEKLINGVSPKVISYLREALFFCNKYLIPNKITNINNLVIVGGGYGMEAAIIYYVCSLYEINVKKIIGIDMENVAKLQNKFFKEIQLDDICKSYGPEYIINENIDYVYSNCCFAELSPETNWKYYENFVSKSKGFFVIWGCWAADIPSYYESYICKDVEINNIINHGLKPNTNQLLVK